MLNFSSFIQNSEVSDALKPFLQQLDMSSSMAECHGLFTGIICSVNKNSINKEPAQQIDWFGLIDLEADKNNLLVKEAIEVLNSFFEMIQNSLSSNEFDFQLAIVEDEPLDIRLADLSLWLQNFLYGISLNAADADNENSLNKASKELQEIVADFVNISHADDYQLEGSEEDEKSIFELMEYVRVGVLLINDELNINPENDKQDKQPTHRPTTQLFH